MCANSYATEITAPVALWRTSAIAGTVVLYLLSAVGIVLIVKRRKENKAVA